MKIKSNIKGFFVRITASNSGATGTSNIVEVYIPGKEVEIYLVDCGEFKEPEYKKYNGDFLFNPRKVRYLLLTHYHVDHYGLIPVLYEQGYYGKILSSEKTIERFKERAMLNYFADKRKMMKDGQEMPYQENTIIDMLKKAESINYNEGYSLSEHVSIIALPSNHIPGATMFLFIVEYGESCIHLLFTGDYKKGEFPKGLAPYKDKQINIVTEGTYGALEKPEPQFFDLMKKCFASNDFWITPIILSISEDRLWEILDKIDEAKKCRIIPQDTIVFIECRKRHYFQLVESISDPHIYCVSSLSQKIQSIFDSRKKIIITTSPGGADYYLQEFISNENSFIINTSYFQKQSKRLKVFKAARGESVLFANRNYVKRARMADIRDFDDHGFAPEILSFLTNFSQINAIFIGHGGKYAKRDLVHYLTQEDNRLKNKVFILRRSDTYQVGTDSVKRYISKKRKN